MSTRSRQAVGQSGGMMVHFVKRCCCNVNVKLDLVVRSYADPKIENPLDVRASHF